MHPAEQLLTDIVSAIATATATVCREIESHQQSQNFRAKNAAHSVRAELQKMPVAASNRETVEDIYATFIAYLQGTPESAPRIRLSIPSRRDMP